MGYYTEFDLHAVDVETQEPITQLEEQIIAKRLWQLSGGSDRYTPRNFQEAIGYDAIKWYNHEEDMLDLSVEYPNIVFVLDGIGEEFWTHGANGFIMASSRRVMQK